MKLRRPASTPMSATAGVGRVNPRLKSLIEDSPSEYAPRDALAEISSLRRHRARRPPSDPFVRGDGSVSGLLCAQDWRRPACQGVNGREQAAGGGDGRGPDDQAERAG